MIRRLAKTGYHSKVALGLALVCLLAGGVTGSTAAQTGPQPAPVNWIKGQVTAPVTLLEYGSLTCGYCAHFNNDIMPTLKRDYIDTGRVRYVFRPFPTPPNNLSVAMHALTLCAGPRRYYQLVDAFFVRQADIFTAAGAETGARGILLAIAADAGGLTYAQSEACLSDPARQQQVAASHALGQSVNVQATPAFFINGTRLEIANTGEINVAHFTTALDAALRSSPPAAARAPAAVRAPTKKATPSKAKKR